MHRIASHKGDALPPPHMTEVLPQLKFFDVISMIYLEAFFK
jgi:hypothetical protein